MGRYNEELRRPACCSRSTGCTRPRGRAVAFAGGRPTVTDGPFAETKELIGGYWLIQARRRRRRSSGRGAARSTATP